LPQEPEGVLFSPSGLFWKERNELAPDPAQGRSGFLMQFIEMKGITYVRHA
jgi:hypothetical protein